MNNTTPHTSNTAEQNIWNLLSTIEDPEIPVLTITDLGIVRNVQITDEAITIFITPTYSGCPATDMIAATIKMTLLAAGYKNIILSTVLSPA
ncbi:MAG: iron-sulfur cluster assembly protein [Flavihumibacter sp.]|nr:iron-sulfur cluster assembly protein [Flavihumibacter sp.]